MADDRMEIGSDIGHDHNTADDYLDLDIDLTTGRPDDEDFVLEDVVSNADFGEHQNLQLGADHVMLDDEEYKDAIYDDDLLHEGQEYDMDQEEPSHSFVTVNEPYSEFHETQDTFDAGEGVSEHPVDPIWENDDPSAIEALGSNVNLQDGEGLQDEAVEDLEGPQDEKQAEENAEDRTEDRTEGATNRESRSTSPRNVSREYIGVEDSASPPTSKLQLSTSRHGSVSHSVPDEYHDEALNEDQKQDYDFSGGRTLPLATENVLVIYQGVEYALFGSSDSDNPDSFFLSDQSIANKPISDFFAGVRDVIHEDLSEEDELCVLVKHLGLEIEETVCSLHDVTISQILELHERLLLNDELESHRPLRIYLTTRPSFARRFASLVTGAADGKGLSQLIVLGEPSDEYNISGDGTEDFEHFAVPGDDVHTAEALDTYAGVVATDLVTEDDEVHSSIEQAGDQDEDEPDYEGDSQDNQSGIDGATHGWQAHQGDAPSSKETPEKRYTPSDGLDEDGDLIDYSDDELEAAPGSAPADPKKNEYEAINEDLRRRSLSRTAEGRQQVREPPPTTSQGQEIYASERLSKVEPERSDEAGDIDFVNEEEEDDANTEDWNDAVIDEGTHKALVVDNTSAIGELETNDYLDLEDDDVGPGEEKPTDISSFAELEDITEAERDETFERNDAENPEPEYEIDYNLDDNLRSPSQPRSLEKPNNIAAPNNGTSKAEDILNSFGAESEAVDNANSSATLSVNNGHDDDGLEFFEDDTLDRPSTIAEKQNPVGDFKDEIDYDDDDYGQDLAAPIKSEKSVLSTIENGGKGKRSWQDSEDGMDVADQDAKRARS